MSRVLRESLPPLPAAREGLVADVIGAQTRGELALRFVPRIVVADGRVAACEAKWTWEHPVHGPLPDTIFVPLLREAGRFDRFDRVARLAIAAHATRWPRHVAAPRLGLRLFLEDLSETDFESRFRESLRTLAIPVENLDLQVSSRAFASGASPALRAIGSLRASGARVVLVDPLPFARFLVACASVPADALLLPASLVSRLDERSKELADARVLAGVASSLGLELHAEGVATTTQEDLLLMLDVRQVQGPLHARPIEGAALEDWLRSRSESTAPPRSSSQPAAGPLFARRR